MIQDQSLNSFQINFIQSNISSSSSTKFGNNQKRRHPKFLSKMKTSTSQKHRLESDINNFIANQDKISVGSMEPSLMDKQDNELIKIYTDSIPYHNESIGKFGVVINITRYDDPKDVSAYDHLSADRIKLFYINKESPLCRLMTLNSHMLEFAKTFFRNASRSTLDSYSYHIGEVFNLYRNTRTQKVEDRNLRSKATEYSKTSYVFLHFYQGSVEIYFMVDRNFRELYWFRTFIKQEEVPIEPHFNSFKLVSVLMEMPRVKDRWKLFRFFWNITDLVTALFLTCCNVLSEFKGNVDMEENDFERIFCKPNNFKNDDGTAYIISKVINDIVQSVVDSCDTPSYIRYQVMTYLDRPLLDSGASTFSDCLSYYSSRNKGVLLRKYCEPEEYDRGLVSLWSNWESQNKIQKDLIVPLSMIGRGKPEADYEFDRSIWENEKTLERGLICLFHMRIIRNLRYMVKAVSTGDTVLRFDREIRYPLLFDVLSQVNYELEIKDTTEFPTLEEISSMVYNPKTDLQKLDTIYTLYLIQGMLASKREISNKHSYIDNLIKKAEESGGIKDRVLQGVVAKWVLDNTNRESQLNLDPKSSGCDKELYYLCLNYGHQVRTPTLTVRHLDERKSLYKKMVEESDECVRKFTESVSTISVGLMLDRLTTRYEEALSNNKIHVENKSHMIYLFKQLTNSLQEKINYDVSSDNGEYLFKNAVCTSSTEPLLIGKTYYQFRPGLSDTNVISTEEKFIRFIALMESFSIEFNGKQYEYKREEFETTRYTNNVGPNTFNIDILNTQYNRESDIIKTKYEISGRWFDNSIIRQKITKRPGSTLFSFVSNDNRKLVPYRPKMKTYPGYWFYGPSLTIFESNLVDELNVSRCRSNFFVLLAGFNAIQCSANVYKLYWANRYNEGKMEVDYNNPSTIDDIVRRSIEKPIDKGKNESFVQNKISKPIFPSVTLGVIPKGFPDQSTLYRSKEYLPYIDLGWIFIDNDEIQISNKNKIGFMILPLRLRSIVLYGEILNYDANYPYVATNLIAEYLPKDEIGMVELNNYFAVIQSKKTKLLLLSNEFLMTLREGYNSKNYDIMMNSLESANKLKISRHFNSDKTIIIQTNFHNLVAEIDPDWIEPTIKKLSSNLNLNIEDNRFFFCLHKPLKSFSIDYIMIRKKFDIAYGSALQRMEALEYIEGTYEDIEFERKDVKYFPMEKIEYTFDIQEIGEIFLTVQTDNLLEVAHKAIQDAAQNYNKFFSYENWKKEIIVPLVVGEHSNTTNLFAPPRDIFIQFDWELLNPQLAYKCLESLFIRSQSSNKPCFVRLSILNKFLDNIQVSSKFGYDIWITLTPKNVFQEFKKVWDVRINVKAKEKLMITLYEIYSDPLKVGRFSHNLISAGISHGIIEIEVKTSIYSSRALSLAGKKVYAGEGMSFLCVGADTFRMSPELQQFPNIPYIAMIGKYFLEMRKNYRDKYVDYLKTTLPTNQILAFRTDPIMIDRRVVLNMLLSPSYYDCKDIDEGLYSIREEVQGRRNTFGLGIFRHLSFKKPEEPFDVNRSLLNPFDILVEDLDQYSYLDEEEEYQYEEDMGQQE